MDKDMMQGNEAMVNEEEVKEEAIAAEEEKAYREAGKKAFEWIQSEEGRREHAKAIYDVAYQSGQLTPPLGEFGVPFDSALAQGIGTACGILSAAAEALNPDKKYEDGKDARSEYYGQLSALHAELSGQLVRFLSQFSSPEELRVAKESAAYWQGFEYAEKYRKEDCANAAKLMDQMLEVFMSSCSLMQSSQCWAVRSFSNAMFPLWQVLSLMRDVLLTEADGKCPEEMITQKINFAKSSALWSTIRLDRLRREVEED